MIVDATTRRKSGNANSDALVEALRAASLPLANATDLDPLLEHIGDARFALLGEATHGTSEFYTWRAEISKRLITEKGFSFIAVEGDWPDSYRVNRYVKGMSDSGRSAEEVLHAFDRWPTWMWANREVVEFVEWLRAHNNTLPPEQRIGFYGLDVYSLWDSMAAVIRYLESVDPAGAQIARRAYSCFDPYYDDEQEYARATALVPMSCERETIKILRSLREREQLYPNDGNDAFFNAEQNAIVAQHAERYYRTMIQGGATSWNVRDRHMVETLERLIAHYGASSRAIVWEHNTHIGDARFTDMARHGMVNVGQLVREAYGEGPAEGDGVALVGFGAARGTVIAGSEWGAPMKRMQMAVARDDSWEDLMHRATEGKNALVLFDGSENGGVAGLDRVLDHRAIGVVYDPRAERWGNYVPTSMMQRYDALLYFDEVRALDSLHMKANVSHEVPETYPSGM